jgi:hypothetical protein
MRPSVLTTSSLIFILGFLFLMSSNPKLFEPQDSPSQDQCFMMFFMTGLSAVIVYHVVLSLYE